MKATFVKKEKNDVEFTIEFTPEEFEDAQIEIYKRTKDSYEVDGFRKGKAPRKLIEQHYGENIFMEDALNDLIGNAYPNVIDELSLLPIDRPRIAFSELKKGAGFTATVTVTVEPEYEIKDYTGVKIKDINHEVKDDDINEELENVQKRNARLVEVDRVAENGDTVIIDYAGFLGDEQFEGGTAERQSLNLGSGQFIPGFEEQLVGAKAGDEVDVNVTFPEEYHSEELKGKAVVFHVKVHEVKTEEKPEINDEFAQDASEFDSLEEWKKDIRVKLEKAAEERNEIEKKNAVIEKVYEANDMNIPDVMVEDQIDQMLQEFAQQLQQQGMDINQYFQYLGKDAKAFREDLRDDAFRRVKTRLMVKTIAAQEEFEASDEEVEEEIKNMSAMYQMEVDQLKAMLGGQTDMIKGDIKNRKAVDYMFENAVIEE